MGIVTGGSPASAQLHAVLASTIAHWEFDGDLLDSVGSEDLANVSGTTRFVDSAVPGKKALLVLPPLFLRGVSDPAPAALRTLGDITVSVLVRPHNFQSLPPDLRP